jgi:predicted RNA-binding Zn-ribbon protein involved in translation (DUF1610 family)
MLQGGCDYEVKLALHSCPNCSEEVVVERCPAYQTDFREYVIRKCGTREASPLTETFITRKV